MLAQPEPQPAKGTLAVRGITQIDLAEAINCSPAYLCAVLNGVREPSLRFKQRLADFLGLPIPALFRDKRYCACGREYAA